MLYRTYLLSTFLALLAFQFSATEVFCQISSGHKKESDSKVPETAEFLRLLLENLAEKLPEEYDISEITERLGQYLEHPIDVNKASREELNNLFFLSPIQINNLSSYIQHQGPLIDLLELQRIDGFDPVTVQYLLPFISIKQSSLIEDLKTQPFFGRSRHDIMFRYSQLLHQKKGFDDLPGSRYLGTPEKLWFRYRYQWIDRISVGLVMEKDPGEALFNRKSLSDHLSASFALTKTGRLKKLVIGDYSMQVGQGLSLWSGFSYGKGPDVTSVAARDVGLKPYSSSNESSFFRGVAATTGIFRNLDITSFISLRKLDASLKVLPEGIIALSNINVSGLHRTATELKNQRSLSQTIYGTALNYTNQGVSFGTLIYNSAYNYPFTTGSAAYNRYAFTGKTLTNLSLNYQYTIKNYFVYGETAHSLHSGWAFLHGLMISFSSRWSAVLLHRKYDKDYHTFFGQAIGEATEVANEQGLYTGINYVASTKWTFAIYADYFQFPWLKYRVDTASSGREWLAQAAFAPNKRFKVQLRYRSEIKQQNADSESVYPGLQDVKKRILRLECNWWLSRNINMQTRAETSSYQKGPLKAAEYGVLLYQDLNYKPLSRLTGNVRFGLFRTSSYNSRLYAYEDDVLYGASSAIYYGNGIRGFLNLRYKLTRQIDVWTRYSIFKYNDQDHIGSGLEQIDGNKKSEFKLQLRYQL